MENLYKKNYKREEGDKNLSDEMRDRSEEGSQTVEDVNLTEDFEEVFRRRGSVSRTPPSSIRPKTSFGTPEPTGTKRQREITPEVKDGFKAAIEMVAKRAYELAALVDRNPNTKVEIKASVKVLRRLTEDLKGKYEDSKSSEASKNKKRSVVKSSRSIATQTEQLSSKSAETQTHEASGEGTRKLEDVIRNAHSDFEVAASIVGEIWPEGAYKATVMAGATETPPRGNFALLLPKQEMKTNPQALKLVRRFGNLSDMLESCGEQVDFLKETATTTTSRGEPKEEVTEIYVLPIPLGAPSQESDRDRRAFGQLIKLRELLKDTPSSDIKIVVGKGARDRKLVECVFALTSTKVEILAEENQKVSKPPTRMQESTLTIKTGDRTYAELVKSLKENVNIGKHQVDVKRISRTEQGNLQLRIAGEEREAAALEGEIRDKFKEWEVARTGNWKTTIFVTGIEEATTQLEVKTALTRELALPESTQAIAVKSLRVGRYGEQTAVVEMPRAMGAQLTKLRTIKIGWVRCPIKELVKVLRCYNCLEHGHIARDCKAEVSRRDTCMKCGQPGHKVKVCPNEAKCLKCGVVGHRCDQMRCPHFKKEVERIRKLRVLTNDKRGHGITSA